jgi:2',3'-cyclic-nucleotide 2'-phosphodiesterase / 3'-nucleotidase
MNYKTHHYRNHHYKNTQIKRICLTTSMIVASMSLVACNNNDNDSNDPKPQQIATNTNLNFTILETSDLHNNVMSYDYYKLTEDKSFGLERHPYNLNPLQSRF